MDFLNRFSQQARDLFASMTPGARITAGLLVAVVVVSVGFLFRGAGDSGGDYLFEGEVFSPAEVRSMTAALASQNLPGFDVSGGRIRVPSAQKDQYLAAIADAGALPVNVQEIMSRAINEGSMFDSSETRRQRIIAAREQQLSRIIGFYPWVAEANVMFTESERRAGLRSKRKAAASVSVQPNSGKVLTPGKKKEIQRLVAGFHPEMTLEDVTVIGQGGADDFAGDEFMADFDNPFFATRVQYEQYVSSQVLGLLTDIPGVRVKVSADIDDTRETTIVDVKPDPQAVALSENEQVEETKQSTGGAGGEVGLVAQGPSRTKTDDTAQRQTHSESLVENRQTQNLIGATQKTEIRYGGKPGEVRASVFVPRSYVEDIWRQRKVAETGAAPEQIVRNEVDDLEKTKEEEIIKLVQPLLGRLPLGENEYGQVNVEFYEVASLAPIPDPSIASTAAAWTGRNWSNLSMMALAAFSLLMVRSLVRGKGGDAPTSPVLNLESDDKSAPVADAGDPEDDPEARPRLKLKKADSLTEDLASIVREDPDAAAAILKSWIGNAG